MDTLTKVEVEAALSARLPNCAVKCAFNPDGSFSVTVTGAMLISSPSPISIAPTITGNQESIGSYGKYWKKWSYRDSLPGVHLWGNKQESICRTLLKRRCIQSKLNT